MPDKHRPVSFRLEKLYLDLIDEAGNCFIIYRAELSMFFIKIHYSRLICSDPDGQTRESYSLGKTVKPENGDIIHISNRHLKAEGSWKRTAAALPVLIYTDEKGRELLWNCHHPAALTKLRCSGIEYSSHGYCETLSLTIKPWKLPIDELRWGRFVSDNYYITWVNWKGPHPLNLIYLNGAGYNDACFDNEDEVTFGGGSFNLSLGKRMVVTEGKLSGLISFAPWLKILFPGRILNVKEVKYKAFSDFAIKGEIISSGWSLYEDVLWKT